MKIIKPSAHIADNIDGSEVLRKIERIGRVCYKSEGKITDTSAAEFVGKLIKSGHESVLEHISVTVHIITDRGISHEIVRHRLASYSQESTRYCNYNGDIEYIKPIDIDVNSQEYDSWIYGIAGTTAAYQGLITKGAKPQTARAVLPNSLKTELYMTANLREWRHFFALRATPAAHPDMRAIAVPLLAEFKSKIPVVFDDIKEG